MKDYGSTTLLELSGELVEFANAIRRESKILLNMDNEDYIELINEECRRLMDEQKEIRQDCKLTLMYYRNSFKLACKNVANMRNIAVA